MEEVKDIGENGFQLETILNIFDLAKNVKTAVEISNQVGKLRKTFDLFNIDSNVTSSTWLKIASVPFLFSFCILNTKVVFYHKMWHNG